MKRLFDWPPTAAPADGRPGIRRRVGFSFRIGRSGRSRSRNGFVTAVALAALYTVFLLCWGVYRAWVRPEWLAGLPLLARDALMLLEGAATVTLLMLWGSIGYYWRRERQQKVWVLARESLFHLSPTGFEHYVADLFRAKGYQVRVRGRSGDLGVDLEIADDSGRRAIVQCKRYQGTVGPDVVRELYGTLVHERVAHGFLVTSADISPAARRWARGKPLTLIDGAALVRIATSLAVQSEAA